MKKRKLLKQALRVLSDPSVELKSCSNCHGNVNMSRLLRCPHCEHTGIEVIRQGVRPSA